ncbi:MAG: NB-ARC domain-containing protein [Nostoc sp. CmiVER01]|uniref:NB-ARC domain-containing protein n=1 Tax=Nostoc sp. CmiVER01 TaxID=3075384 RepID=UPI002AD45F4A|nr:NB-ARC domain-containing protein [Nostoc sp. CmiVER01]MDZ8126790.1 NB-ARC domain-containing protein [Nostoc sp. CmiVER01]
MEPLTAGAIAIGTVIAIKALEKTGEKVGGALWDKTGQFLVTLKKYSPDTVVAIEKAPSQPLDYGKALLEVESAAKANAEVNQAAQELATAAETHPSPKLAEILREIKEAVEQQSQKLYPSTFIQNIEKAINAAQTSTIEQRGSTFNIWLDTPERVRVKLNPQQAPPLPTYYVDRPEYRQDLKTRLLTESSNTKTLVITAIHGLGSVGKSTLATALAHDKDVQTHFCDGILWATLGQQPNLLSLLSGWVQALEDYNFKAASVEAASNHLRTLLYDKAVLLVVDDAWNLEDAQAFNVGGARCQVLVTTREAGIATFLGASTYSLDVMKSSQAMELLTKKLGRNLTDTETQLAGVLAKELGYLPLALELAAAQVAGGISWTVLVQNMQQEAARLKTLDSQLARDVNDEASLKRLSLTASLNLSIQRLSKETRENFIWLGVLPKGTTITRQITAKLWDMDDERDAADELNYFYSKALLLSGDPLVDGTPTYRLHNLFHDLARNLLTSPPTSKRQGGLPGLGLSLADARAIFLEKTGQPPQLDRSIEVINPFPVTQSEPIVCFYLFFNISSHSTTVGGELAVTVELSPDGNDNRNVFLLEVSRTEAIGSELNIFLTAPGFQFNNDNTTSLPIDPDTATTTQTASFNLIALRSGITKIKAELFCGETYKTTLETEVEVTAFEETELRPLIAARSRPVPQPDIILQVRTTWNADISACTFNYHIDSYQPRLLFADDVDYNSQSLSTTWVERSHSLLKTTLEEAATSLREDFRSRLVSLGQYLFQSLLPEELQNTFRTIAGFNRPFTLLILADQDAWFPWELLHDGQKFLGDHFIIGRWLWELEKSRPYEFPVGAVNVAHYASVEQPELWTELLQSSGAPPPISMQAGIFNDITLFESIRGLHLIRYGQSVDTTNRQDAPVRVNSSSDIQNIEREVQPAKLSLRRNHPLVSLSYLNAGQPELTALEQTWASTFVRAGCSAFVGSLWTVQPNVEAAFVSAFYNSIWAGQTLGVAFQTARRLAKTVVPESWDWLAYVLFGDPMARPYRPVQGQGYAVVEPIGQEIDDPVSPGSTVRFRVSLRRTPPVWYENRLMEVAEDLSFDDLRVFIVTSGLQVTPGDSILMTRTATGDYLGWFTLTAPAEMESRSVLVQVYFEDGIEAVHNLRFALNIVKQDGEAQ